MAKHERGIDSSVSDEAYSIRVCGGHINQKEKETYQNFYYLRVIQMLSNRLAMKKRTTLLVPHLYSSFLEDMMKE